jgi:drug/metabolite transporter (DMT)-like permease
VIALGGPASSAVVVVVVRLRPTVDMTPATVGAGFVGLSIGLGAASDLTIPWRDAGLSLLLGFVQIGIGFTALNFGARYVPAAEVSLFALAEPVLAPLWVWIAVAEVPTLLGFVGAGLVIVAAGSISVHRLFESRRRNRDPAFEAP